MAGSLIMFFALQANALDGKSVFLTCAGCHGDNGVSVNPEWPNLAGQKKEYLQKQIHDFKAGVRKNALMEPMAQMLSEEDIIAVTTYLSEQKSQIAQ
jgi:cytochrome c553